MINRNQYVFLNTVFAVVALGFVTSCSAVRNLTNSQTSGNQLSSSNSAVLNSTGKRFPVSPDKPIPAEYLKFAPVQVGASVGQSAFKFQPGKSDSVTGASSEAVRFVYSNRNYLDVVKYGTADAAQAEVKKRASSAVASAEYDKKVKLPKCDPDKEAGDYIDTPDELIKTLPVKSGGDAYMIRVGKYWDYECKVDDTVRDDKVVWSDRIYFFLINSPFSKAEAFFNDYRKTVGQ